MHDGHYRTTIVVPGYRGPERRGTAERRASIPAEECSWRLRNLAFASEDRRDTFGRRRSDTAFMNGPFD